MGERLNVPQPTKPLGYAPLDAVHAEFDDLVARTLACADDELLSCLERLQTHLRSHFGQEDDWMRESGFPAGDCHIEEHRKVLESAAQVVALVARGNLAIGRAFTAELDRWFPGHADYLDSALAAWLCKRQFGGKPVVMHAPRSRA
jgi:hemerythrin